MNEYEFQFTAPAREDDLSEQANLAVGIGAMASRLVAEERTRCVHPDGRAENVAEHSLMLVKVAVALAGRFYPHLDAGKVAIYAAGHDDVEAYVGDTPTDLVNGMPDFTAKEAREKAGLAALVAEYASIAPDYAATIETYEAQQEPEARFVRIVDKLMVILIHIPNQGAELKRHYTERTFVDNNATIIEKFRNEYPEFTELHDLRLELAQYVAEKYLSE